MKLTAAYNRRVGLRWGRLLAGCEHARMGIQVVRNSRDLLSPELEKEVNRLSELFLELEIELWNAEKKAIPDEKEPAARKR